MIPEWAERRTIRLAVTRLGAEVLDEMVDEMAKRGMRVTAGHVADAAVRTAIPADIEALIRADLEVVSRYNCARRGS